MPSTSQAGEPQLLPPPPVKPAHDRDDASLPPAKRPRRSAEPDTDRSRSVRDGSRDPGRHSSRDPGRSDSRRRHEQGRSDSAKPGSRREERPRSGGRLDDSRGRREDSGRPEDRGRPDDRGRADVRHRPEPRDGHAGRQGHGARGGDSSSRYPDSRHGGRDYPRDRRDQQHGDPRGRQDSYRDRGRDRDRDRDRDRNGDRDRRSERERRAERERQPTAEELVRRLLSEHSLHHQQPGVMPCICLSVHACSVGAYPCTPSCAALGSRAAFLRALDLCRQLRRLMRHV